MESLKKKAKEGYNQVSQERGIGGMLAPLLHTQSVLYSCMTDEEVENTTPVKSC